MEVIILSGGIQMEEMKFKITSEFIKTVVRRFVFLFFGASIAAFAIECFLVPNKIMYQIINFYISLTKSQREIRIFKVKYGKCVRAILILNECSFT